MGKPGMNPNYTFEEFSVTAIVKIYYEPPPTLLPIYANNFCTYCFLVFLNNFEQKRFPEQKLYLFMYPIAPATSRIFSNTTEPHPVDLEKFFMLVLKFIWYSIPQKKRKSNAKLFKKITSVLEIFQLLLLQTKKHILK